MKQPSDEQLILHYYGESDAPAEIEAALADPEVAARWRALSRVLDAVPREAAHPERPVDYGEAVWRRVRYQLGRRPRRRPWSSGWGSDLRWAATAAVLAIVVGAFWAGGLWRERTAPESTAAEVEVDRVLILAVAEYLEKSERLLVEVANRGAGENGGEVDLSVERALADRLTGAGRLYRQAAARAGAFDLAYLLQQLEPILTELAHAPAAATGEDLAALRNSLERQDVLFKLRVAAEHLERETLESAQRGAAV
ncbi:MAG: hypothetical protein ACRD0X_00760 [Thermoanaerobaculia bacterium]